ncbi:MAG: hypothetical protein HYU05_00770 [Candidatus Wildermuthbacteria bacterium]|nr:hypothetical protein [Candidatus Wildermuthbacteria bacterium]
MAITFTEERSRQTYLIWVLAGVLLFTLIVLWRGYFGQGSSFTPAEEKIVAPKTVDMRWDILDPGVWEGRSTLAAPPSVSEIQGRNNPFLPSRP